MSEKIADDYGFEKLAAYLAAHAYTGGDSGTFAVASDADMDAVFTTGETTNNTYDESTIYVDWSDKKTVKGTIARQYTPAWHARGICNYVHVPGNSNIMEYMINTDDANLGRNGFVSMESGGCFVPYFLDVINKQIYKNNDYAKVTENLKSAGKTIDSGNYPKLRDVEYFSILFGSFSAYIDYLGGAS